MNVIALILLGSVVVVPVVALWSLHWASRTGEFRFMERTALLPFDDEEPVDRPTDQILNRGGDRR